MKSKHKRFITLFSLLIIFFVGCVLLFLNLKNNLVFFYSPTEIRSMNIDKNKKIRIGGMVSANSIDSTVVFDDDGSKVEKISFIITDNKNSIEVSYVGILPDLFSEGKGVVVEGRLIEKFNFVADNVLAKHDENYMPPELSDLIEGEKYDR